jgi:hypothetical protein
MGDQARFNDRVAQCCKRTAWWSTIATTFWPLFAAHLCEEEVGPTF